jgi:hypothetical protein
VGRWVKASEVIAGTSVQQKKSLFVRRAKYQKTPLKSGSDAPGQGWLMLIRELQ